MKLGTKIKNYVARCFDEGTQIDRQNIAVAVYLGGPTHFSLYFVYQYWFGLTENIYFRALAAFLCISVGAYSKLPEKVKKYWFPLYWHLMLIVALPFILIFNLFNTNFDETWLYWNIFMVLILALYVPNWLIYFIDLAVGVGLAFLCYIFINHGIHLQPHFNIPAYLIVFLFSSIAGIIFVHGNRGAWLFKQRQRDLALAVGIAHDVRSFIFRLKGLFSILFLTLKDKKNRRWFCSFGC